MLAKQMAKGMLCTLASPSLHEPPQPYDPEEASESKGGYQELLHCKNCFTARTASLLELLHCNLLEESGTEGSGGFFSCT